MQNSIIQSHKHDHLISSSQGKEKVYRDDSSQEQCNKGDVLFNLEYISKEGQVTNLSVHKVRHFPLLTDSFITRIL